MPLQIAQAEAMRLKQHLNFSQNCSKAHYTVPIVKKEQIMQKYRAGQSIRFICKNFHIGRNTFYKIRAEMEGY